MGSLEHPFVRHLIERASATRARIGIPDAQFDTRFLEVALQARSRPQTSQSIDDDKPRAATASSL